MSRFAAFVLALILSSLALPAAADGERPVSDRDGDGVADSIDRCPNTPLRSSPFHAGCAAVQFLARPDVLVAPLRSALEGARAALLVNDDTGAALLGPEAKRLERDLGTAQQRLDESIALIRRGQICDGTKRLSLVREQVDATSFDTHAVMLDVRRRLDELVSPDDSDSDAVEVRFHEIGYRAGAVGRLTAMAREFDDAVQPLCERIEGRTTTPAVVVYTDTARGLVYTSGRRVLAIADGVDTSLLVKGAKVSITITEFDGGTGFLERIEPDGEDLLDAGLVPDQIEIRCMSLRIAPYQPFNPPLSVLNSYVLHDPRGYEVSDDTLVLEAPMRLAAQAGGCLTGPQATPGQFVQLIFYRYSLKVEYRDASASAFVTVDSDLTPFDHPIALPSDAMPTATSPVRFGVLRVTEQQQICVGLALPYRCSTEPEARAVREYGVAVFRRASLASASYGRTVFELEDWDPASSQVGVVTGVTLAPVLDGAAVTFRAQARSFTGSGALQAVSRPGFPFFGVYNDDFFDPDVLYDLDAHGTNTRSGLRWPRVEGTRDGFPFRYSVALPDILRDRVTDCAAPDSYYRLPWADGDTRRVGQGNNNPLPGSHNGSQSFAFDVDFDTGEVIRAARGGRVSWFQQSQTTNFNPNEPVGPGNQPYPNGDLRNWGNALRIEHDDGTFAYYFHLDTNGVLVALDERIERGQPIARADNTGRSTDPHLHFQVQASAADWGQSIQIRFQTSDDDCVIPEGGDDVTSNNVNPNHP